MKKRLLCLALCLLLVFRSASFPARALDTAYFVAAGVEVQPLTDRTMPFWSGGYLYVPASIFTGSAWRVLGVSVYETRDMVILYTGDDHSLTFSSQSCRSSEGVFTTVGAVWRSGVAFVPAYQVAQYFSLVYSVTSLKKDILPDGLSEGYLVWIRQPGFGLTLEDFANAAAYSITDRYRTYQKTAAAAEAAPEVKPPAAEPPETGPTAEKKLFLCFEAGDNTAALLDELDRAGTRGAFFCGPDFLRENGALLRRMTATGHAVGLLAEGGREDLAEQLAEDRRLLEQATCGATRLLRIAGAEEEDLHTAESLGLRIVPAEEERSGGMQTAESAAVLLQWVASLQSDTALWLGDEASVQGLRTFLASVSRSGGQCAAMTEVDLL